MLLKTKVNKNNKITIKLEILEQNVHKNFVHNIDLVFKRSNLKLWPVSILIDQALKVSMSHFLMLKVMKKSVKISIWFL